MIHDVRAQPTLMNSSYGNCKFEALEGCKCVNGTFDVVMETRGNICILSERVTEVLECHACLLGSKFLEEDDKISPA